MEYLKSKEQIVAEKLGSVNESVFKMGDTYKVKTTMNIPKSLINAFVSKAKKEHNIDPRENWSDVDLAEMFVAYISATFVNVESLPVNAILGDKVEGEAPGAAQASVEPTDAGVPLGTPQAAQPEIVAPEVPAQPIQAAQGEPTASIENQGG